MILGGVGVVWGVWWYCYWFGFIVVASWLLVYSVLFCCYVVWCGVGCCLIRCGFDLVI